ncbi:ABC transporter substrate-binding protein [Anaeropeptidivorans aminofermentans]|uniref:ABC transporter substrate-binding protein n=1 Tax=Anaeropeptidivorans aminofermentans TaxID=2934315 RepID=UPI0020258463|nr:ABC transporter substrate-binding protein [Anaeropeptidivorans aminofermentans]
MKVRVRPVFFSIVIFILAAAGLMGCTKSKESTEKEIATAKSAVTFTDALGKEISVENPENVAAVMGSFAETWLLAGGELAGVTEDAYSERELDLGEGVVDLGLMKSPSVEKLIEMDTDLVILSSNIAEHVDLYDAINNAGITTAYFDVESFDDYLQMLKICTDITGRKDLYEKNGLEVQKQIEEAIKGIKGESPKVLFIRAFSTGAKAKGSDNMTGIMLKDMGCINIADNDKSLLEDLSIESIISEDPDYIFVVTMGASSEKAIESLKKGIQSNPAWNELSAVKNDRYIVLPKDLFHYKPNARWGESYEMLKEILYSDKTE